MSSPSCWFGRGYNKNVGMYTNVPLSVRVGDVLVPSPCVSPNVWRTDTPGTPEEAKHLYIRMMQETIDRGVALATYRRIRNESTPALKTIVYGTVHVSGTHRLSCTVVGW